MDEKVEALAELFRDTAVAHHEAYSATDGDEPAWPLWYADYLYDKLPAYIDTTMSKEDLADELERLDNEVEASPEEEDWALHYAQSLLNKAS